MRDSSLCGVLFHKFLVSIILDTIQGNLIIACPYQPGLPRVPPKKYEDGHSSGDHCQVSSEQTSWNTPKDAASDCKKMDFITTFLRLF